MLARHWSFVSGSMVPSYASIVEFSSLATYPFFGVSSSGGGLFGHPVILNGSGALSYLQGSFSADWAFPPIRVTDLADRSGKAATSSVCPEDKLR
jgi:hypothetical protein